jgi:tRNA-(ms[2]io[6]A)-hydroxylase
MTSDSTGSDATGISKDVQRVLDFLVCETPVAWFAAASDNLDLLLIDHAHCEKKAAGTALSLLYRYVDRPELLQICSRLAREELKHFEQVHALIVQRGIDYRHISPSRYASGLRSCVRTTEPERLVDTLLTAAVVEARSCERFLGLTRVLDEDLAVFYRRLLASEARHFEQYLALAELYATKPFDDKVAELLERDAHLVTDEDEEFRFHSGPIVASSAIRDQAAENTQAETVPQSV